MNESAANVLQVLQLQARYGGNLAIQIEALNIRPGEMVGVIGANGAGKSTLVNAILGWSRGQPKISGRIHLAGEDISHLPPFQRVRKGLALVPENKLIFDQLTVEQNLIDSGTTQDTGDRRKFSMDDIYALFPNLKNRRHHRGSQLSGGERQMLGIAHALRLAPRALLLDEPSIGLAPMLVQSVLATVRELAQDGLAVLLVEQNIHAALRVTDRMLLLERGKLVLEGTPSELKINPVVAQVYLGRRA
ncbi:ABC transporter ATP-binding protein [Castellaniella sp.]|uniref:ABC transporter ATP-binding protein n=1 Tax=Castellaniella sp. TaxID=1955812 RepID=UPI00355F59EC